MKKSVLCTALPAPLQHYLLQVVNFPQVRFTFCCSYLVYIALFRQAVVALNEFGRKEKLYIALDDDRLGIGYLCGGEVG